MRIHDLNKLTRQLFTVRVPLVATYSEDEIELYGLPVNIVKGKKQDSMDNLTTVMLPLESIIDIYKQGFFIRLVNKEDLNIIYSQLEDYINGIEHGGKRSINVQEGDVDKLNDVDKFLTEMFDNNKPSLVRGMISGNSGFNLGVDVMRSRTGSTFTGEVKKTSLLAGYEDSNTSEVIDTGVSTTKGVTFISEECQPVIDMTKIKRTTTVRHRSGRRYVKKD